MIERLIVGIGLMLLFNIKFSNILPISVFSILLTITIIIKPY